MTYRLECVPIPDPRIISKIVEGEAILIHPSQGKVRVLNQVGARIWELLDGVRNGKQIIQIIVEEYAVGYEVIQEDYLKFVESLQQAGLITIKE